VVLTLLFAGGFSRLFTAEVLHRQALNKGLGTSEAFNFEQRALQLFPWRAIYHTTHALTSFGLANQFAGKENPTDEEKNQIQLLVAQAIEEGREATNLSPLDVGNWENLAQIYRSLVGLAEDAETWAADAYQRAIGLDLFNPILRVNLGGLYFQTGQFELAVEQFRTAVNLKPEFANAHYNLAVAYREIERIDLAIKELELTLRLSTSQTQGYDEAKLLLEELKAQQ